MEFNAMEASAKECLAYYQAKLDEEAWEAKKNGFPEIDLCSG